MLRPTNPNENLPDGARDVSSRVLGLLGWVSTFSTGLADESSSTSPAVRATRSNVISTWFSSFELEVLTYRSQSLGNSGGSTALAKKSPGVGKRKAAHEGSLHEDGPKAQEPAEAPGDAVLLLKRARVAPVCSESLAQRELTVAGCFLTSEPNRVLTGDTSSRDNDPQENEAEDS